ncbi:Uncharacterised protein [Moraxella atlantae]|uniref:Uncharacterized protein n=1 Tax=Faucicola atlantae TaxID=34059 RepID=A0A378Q4S1_9GAMM|nr:Uncharacterised protein [Moraxella atlantae]
MELWVVERYPSLLSKPPTIPSTALLDEAR